MVRTSNLDTNHNKMFTCGVHQNGDGDGPVQGGGIAYVLERNTLLQLGVHLVLCLAVIVHVRY